MLKRIISGAVASTLSAALLAGCGGGGGSQAVPSTPSGGGSKTTNAKFTIKIPASAATHTKNGKKAPLYVSRNTKGIGVEFGASPVAAFAAGNAPSTTPDTAAAIAPGAPGCDASAGSDGSFNCTVYLAGVPVGYNDLRITLWDAAPASGSFAGDHALAINVVSNIVTLAGIDNTLGPFTTLPVVDSAYAQLTSGIVNGTASTVTGYVVAKDAQGNIILGGDQFVDANFNNITLTPVINNGGTSLTFSAPASVAFATSGTNQFTLAYDGLTQFATGGAAQPNVSISVANATATVGLQGSNLEVTNSNNNITVPGQPQVTLLHTYGAAPAVLTVGSDAAIWMTGGGGITRTDASGNTTGWGGGQGLIGTAGAIAAGSEGYLWYTDTADNAVGRFAPTSGATISVTETPSILGATLSAIALGPNGNIWVADSAHNQLDMVDPNNFNAAFTGGSNQFNLGNSPAGLAIGPLVNGGNDKTMCAIEPAAPGNGAIECLDLTTHLTFGSPTTATPHSLVVGPDNKVYVGELGQIEIFTVQGSQLAVGSTTKPLASGSAYVQALAANSDGNLWFVEGGAASPTFGNLNIQSATPALNEFSANTGIAAGATPFSLVLDKNNSTLYFTDNTNDALDYITP